MKKTFGLMLGLATVYLFACGCMPTGEVWYVDSRFTLEEEQQILAAHDQWVALGAEQQMFLFGQRVDANETGRRAIVKAGARAAAYAWEGFRPEGGDAAVMQRDDLNRVYRIIMVPDYIESQ